MPIESVTHIQEVDGTLYALISYVKIAGHPVLRLLTPSTKIPLSEFTPTRILEAVKAKYPSPPTMSDFRESLPHTLPIDKARERILEFLGKIQAGSGGQIKDLRQSWNGNNGTFSLKARGNQVTGKISVQSSAVVIEGETNFLAVGAVREKLREHGIPLMSAPEPAAPTPAPATPTVEIKLLPRTGPRPTPHRTVASAVPPSLPIAEDEDEADEEVEGDVAADIDAATETERAYRSRIEEILSRKGLVIQEEEDIRLCDMAADSCDAVVALRIEGTEHFVEVAVVFDDRGPRITTFTIVTLDDEAIPAAIQTDLEHLLVGKHLADVQPDSMQHELEKLTSIDVHMEADRTDPNLSRTDAEEDFQIDLGDDEDVATALDEVLQTPPTEPVFSAEGTEGSRYAQSDDEMIFGSGSGQSMDSTVSVPLADVIARQARAAERETNRSPAPQAEVAGFTAGRPDNDLSQNSFVRDYIMGPLASHGFQPTAPTFLTGERDGETQVTVHIPEAEMPFQLRIQRITGDAIIMGIEGLPPVLLARVEVIRQNSEHRLEKFVTHFEELQQLLSNKPLTEFSTLSEIATRLKRFPKSSLTDAEMTHVGRLLQEEYGGTSCTEIQLVGGMLVAILNGVSIVAGDTEREQYDRAFDLVEQLNGINSIEVKQVQAMSDSDGVKVELCPATGDWKQMTIRIVVDRAGKQHLNSISEGTFPPLLQSPVEKKLITIDDFRNSLQTAFEAQTVNLSDLPTMLTNALITALSDALTKEKANHQADQLQAGKLHAGKTQKISELETVRDNRSKRIAALERRSRYLRKGLTYERKHSDELTVERDQLVPLRTHSRRLIIALLGVGALAGIAITTNVARYPELKKLRAQAAGNNEDPDSKVLNAAQEIPLEEITIAQQVQVELQKPVEAILRFQQNGTMELVVNGNVYSEYTTHTNGNLLVCIDSRIVEFPKQPIDQFTTDLNNAGSHARQQALLAEQRSIVGTSIAIADAAFCDEVGQGTRQK